MTRNKQDEEQSRLNLSHALDSEVIFRSIGPTAEIEALGIKTVLEANGIDVMLNSSFAMPNLSFEVRVPHEQVEKARQILADAEQAGPSGAEEAERAGEDSAT